MRIDLDDVTMEQIFIVFAVLFGLLIISFVFFIAVKKKRDRENAAQPIQTSHAKLIDKQQLAPGTILSISEMWVMFELDDGRRVRLIAKAENSLVLGDKGVLTWQGNKIIRFERRI